MSGPDRGAAPSGEHGRSSRPDRASGVAPLRLGREGKAVRFRAGDPWWGVPFWRGKSFRLRAERGAVTAETAAMLPALMVVLAAALWAVKAVEAQLQCVDAARAGARAAARGESVENVREITARLAPADAHMAIHRGPDTTQVTVSATVHPQLAHFLPAIVVHATSTSATEPGVDAGDDFESGSAEISAAVHPQGEAPGHHRPHPREPPSIQERHTPLPGAAGVFFWATGAGLSRPGTGRLFILAVGRSSAFHSFGAMATCKIVICGFMADSGICGTPRQG